MIKRHFVKYAVVAATLGVVTLGMSAPVFAADDTVYGSQLMTSQERLEHRDRLRNAKSAEERQQIQNEHHKRMQARAEERGVSIPDTPPASGQGKGMGPGDGKGGGMGSGMGGGRSK